MRFIYYEFDAQGSVSQRLNASGTVLSSSVYDAYGAETNFGTPNDPFGYNAQWGYWYDRDTGMYRCQARWYDPVTARWVTRDPIGYAGGANLYGYCGGGPVGWADPSGLRPHYRLPWDPLVIAGDTSGRAAPSGWFADIDNPTYLDVVQIFLDESEPRLRFVGHGDQGELQYGRDESAYMTAEDVIRIGRLMKRLGVPKKQRVTVDECFVLSDYELVRALFTVAEAVDGFEGWTFDPDSGRLGDRVIFIDPPGPADSPNPDPYLNGPLWGPHSQKKPSSSNQPMPPVGASPGQNGTVRWP